MSTSGSSRRSSAPVVGPEGGGSSCWSWDGLLMPVPLRSSSVSAISASYNKLRLNSCVTHFCVLLNRVLHK